MMPPLSRQRTLLSGSLHLLLLLSSAAGGVNALPGSQEPIFGEVNVEGEGGDSCHNACTALVNEFGDTTHYGPPAELPGFSEYYSFFQSEIVPACIITPKSATQVASIISLLRNYPCPLAIKSGGHGISPGLSSVAGGITIDLRLLNEVEYLGAKDWDGTPAGKSADGWEGQIARLGPGSRWGRVYKTLQTHGVSIVGGRDSNVGVGGFVLGGGISFLSHTHGWAADTVRNYQIVLPNGTLTNVNRASNPNLFSALRGGGSNFGIVTRFDMETYAQGPVWGGYRIWAASPFDISARKEKIGIPVGSSLTFAKLTQLRTLGHALLDGFLRVATFFGYGIKVADLWDAFEALVLSPDVDQASHLFMSFAYIKSLGQYFMVGPLVHIKGVVEPEIFKHHSRLKAVYSNTRVTNISDVADEIAAWNYPGFRQVWNSQTLLASPSAPNATLTISTFLSETIDIFIAEVEKIKHLDDIIPSFTAQPINLNEIKHFQKNGGNALGIGADEGPFVLLSSAISWTATPGLLAVEEPLVRAAADTFHSRCREMARANGMHHRFRYLNYADSRGDAFEGAGAEKREWLREVKRSVLGGERWDVAGIKI